MMASDDSEVNCQVLLIATGVSYRQLEIPGLERLTGAGVYYGLESMIIRRALLPPSSRKVEQRAFSGSKRLKTPF
jgi:hypothetical protein